MSDARRHRVGVDVGGTFTDVAAHDGTGWRFAKTLTTPRDLAAGILAGVRDGVGGDHFDGIGTLVHGTTLVANAIIERKGARTALVTTQGFRDALEIGREPRYDLFDLFLDKPRPMVPRPLRLEVRERRRGDGAVLLPLDEESVRLAARRILAADCESVAVVLLHSFLDPSHEERIAEILSEMCPGLDVSLSSLVCPEIGEYARTATTVANAYVRPLVHRYVAGFQSALQAHRFRGELLLMRSNGAVVTPDLAAPTPIQMIESGPAAGAIAASVHGRACGFPNLISFDMGGTTAKICVIRAGTPARATEFEAARLHRFKRGSGVLLKVPVIELIEIGAGGGSLARLNGMGLLEVGPESAGADPGPACYGLGGTRPTVTDADLILGHLNPDYFLGGRMTLSPTAARDAVAAGVAGPLGVDVTAAARGIVELVNSQMATAMRLHAVECGVDPSEFSLFAFGGAGPVHAYDLARRLRIRRIICPLRAGVASAVGLVLAARAVELSQSHFARLDRLEVDTVRQLLVDLEGRARRQFRRNDPAREARVLRSVEMRYAGQGHAISVPLAEDVRGVSAAGLQTAFEAAYRSQYGRVLAGHSIEALTWRVWIEGSGVDAPWGPSRASPGEGPAVKGERPVFFFDAGGFVPCPIYDRARLRAGTEIPGPAVVEEAECTIGIGPAGVGRVDEFLNVIIEVA